MCYYFRQIFLMCLGYLYVEYSCSTGSLDSELCDLYHTHMYCNTFVFICSSLGTENRRRVRLFIPQRMLCALTDSTLVQEEEVFMTRKCAITLSPYFLINSGTMPSILSPGEQWERFLSA